jgi:hypothetical protein
MAAIVLSLATVLASGAVVEGATVHLTGTKLLANEKSFDLDDGSVGRILKEDLGFSWDTDGPYLLANAPAAMRKMGSTKPSRSTCRSAALRKHIIGFRQLPQDTWLCVKTDEGRFARVQIMNDPGSRDCCAAVRFRWTTWN